MCREVVCGAPALNFKRDHMKIESLYSESGGLSKLFWVCLTFVLFVVNFDYLEKILD